MDPKIEIVKFGGRAFRTSRPVLGYLPPMYAKGDISRLTVPWNIPRTKYAKGDRSRWTAPWNIPRTKYAKGDRSRWEYSKDKVF